MKKTLAAALAALLAAAALSGCGRKVPPAAPATLAVASDLHYVGEAIEDGGELFTRVVEEGDGRQLDYIRPITDAFLAEVAEDKPDALILTGDLSFNGEKASHQELAAKLNELVEAGVPVYVLPGNHDVNNYAAATYLGSEQAATDFVTPEEFEEIYKNCGFSAADSRDKASLSYMVKLNAGVWLFMLDTQPYYLHEPGFPYCVGGVVQDGTWTWLEKQLEKCAAAGAVPLVALHQNLAVHNERFTTGYRIYDNDRLGELLAQYGGQLVFSGHLHPQHIALWQGGEGQQVWDVASESLAVWPYLSGRVTISPDGAGRASYDYEAKPTDVTAWAAATGQTDPVFEDFSAFGREQFAQNSTSRGADKFVEAYDFPRAAESSRNIASDDPRTQLRISYFYEFAYVKASWELAEDAGPDATWWDLKYYQLRSMAPAGMVGKGLHESQTQLFQDNTTPFRDRQSTFPVLRCFWHMKGLTPEKNNTPVYNLSYDGNIFYSGPPAWEVNSWTQK